MEDSVTEIDGFPKERKGSLVKQCAAQQPATKMAADLVLSERMSDVILKVRHDGFSWRFPSHSLILTNSSPAFQEILEERTEDEKPLNVSLVGMKPETAAVIMKYIYTGELPFDVTADLLIASDRYSLPSLRIHLEERLFPDMTLLQACQILEELQERQSVDVDCAIKSVCCDFIEHHALTVFGSDLVLLLSRRTLLQLLKSDRLNVPDEAFLFWGVWRWGRRQCSKTEKCLREVAVVEFIDDLIVLIRMCSLRNRKGIPAAALQRFDRCKGRRCSYCVPSDSFDKSATFRTCPSWDDLSEPTRKTDTGILCLQVSFEKDVLMFGMILEVVANEKPESYIRIYREIGYLEIRRQAVNWCRSKTRKTSTTGKPECWMEADLMFNEPVFLSAGQIYSVYLLGEFHSCHLPWGAFDKQRIRVESNFVSLHGEGVTAVRDVFLAPDVTVTWGPRMS